MEAGTGDEEVAFLASTRGAGTSSSFSSSSAGRAWHKRVDCSQIHTSNVHGIKNFR